MQPKSIPTTATQMKLSTCVVETGVRITGSPSASERPAFPKDCEEALLGVVVTVELTSHNFSDNPIKIEALFIVEFQTHKTRLEFRFNPPSQSTLPGAIDTFRRMTLLRLPQVRNLLIASEIGYPACDEILNHLHRSILGYSYGELSNR